MVGRPKGFPLGPSSNRREERAERGYLLVMTTQPPPMPEPFPGPPDIPEPSPPDIPEPYPPETPLPTPEPGPVPPPTF